MSEATENLAKLQARRAELSARADALEEAQRAATAKVHEAIASGRAPTDKQRRARDDALRELEEVEGAIIVLDGQITAARATVTREQAEADAAALATAENGCERWGAKLRDLLAPVAAHLATEGELDAAYKAALRPLHGGRADGNAADAAGFGIARLQKLRAAVLEAVR